MPAIPFPKTSAPGASAQEGAGRLINCHVAPLQNGAKGALSRRRAPGLARLCDTGLRGPRGMLAVGSSVLAAYRDVLVRVDADGTVSELGRLPGAKRITLARNNRAPTPDVIAVTEYAAYRLTLEGAPVPLTIPSAFPVPNAVTAQDGYLILSAGDGRSYVTGLNDTTFSTLNYTTEQGHPGGLLRAVAYRSELFLFGPQGIGIYRDAGNANGFPFSKVTDIPQGLIGPWAVAGFEEGWVNQLFWVGQDWKVYQLAGYGAQPVSTDDVERAIEAAAGIDPTGIEACVFAIAGHAYLVLSAPDWTWVYDVSTGQWHERVSHGLMRWRGSQSVKAFGRWLVGDTAGSGLLAASETAFLEDGDPLTMRIESLACESFPSRLAVPRVDFDFVVGQGRAGSDPTLADPKVLVSWSDDGGRSFGSPLTRSLGGQGASRTRVSVLRTGMAGPTGRVWRLEVSDPVYVALLGGQMAVEARTE